MLKPEGALQRKVLRSWEPSGAPPEDWPQQGAPRAEAQASGREEGSGCDIGAASKDSALLRDHEIRASLTKHFGVLEAALEDEDRASCKSPEYDAVFEDGSSSSGGESGFLLEEEEEDDEEEDSGVSPPRSDHCPYQSPLGKAGRQPCSRSRSSSSSSSCRSRSPATRRTFRYGGWWPPDPRFQGVGTGRPWEQGCVSRVACVLVRAREVASGGAVGPSGAQQSLLCGSPGAHLRAPRKKKTHFLAFGGLRAQCI